jgi:hypothetical protein
VTLYSHFSFSLSQVNGGSAPQLENPTLDERPNMVELSWDDWCAPNTEGELINEETSNEVSGS